MLDLRHRFDMPATPYTKETVVIVVRADDRQGFADTRTHGEFVIECLVDQVGGTNDRTQRGTRIDRSIEAETAERAAVEGKRCKPSQPTECLL